MSVMQAVRDEGFHAGPQTSVAPHRQISSVERFEIAAELLEALDEATRAGQGHLMRRILDVIREEILWLGPWLTGPRRAMVTATMTDLDHEVARLLPDPQEFRSRTSDILKLLPSNHLPRHLERSTPVPAAGGRELNRPRS
jgi:hypothetical protein